MCGCLSRSPAQQTWPSAQACALTRNWTSNPLVLRPAFNPLSHTSQEIISHILKECWNFQPTSSCFPLHPRSWHSICFFLQFSFFFFFFFYFSLIVHGFHNIYTCTNTSLYSVFLFWRFYLFVFRERERLGEREGEKLEWVVASSRPITRFLAHNSGMYPHRESNQQPFGFQASTQTTEAL